jgi:hypothetical protein
MSGPAYQVPTHISVAAASGLPDFKYLHDSFHLLSSFSQHGASLVRSLVLGRKIQGPENTGAAAERGQASSATRS